MNRLQISIVIAFFACLETSYIYGTTQITHAQTSQTEDVNIDTYCAGYNKYSGKAYFKKNKAKNNKKCRGKKKSHTLVEEGPDSDVITIAAIKEDYGIGE